MGYRQPSGSYANKGTLKQNNLRPVYPSKFIPAPRSTHTCLTYVLLQADFLCRRGKRLVAATPCRPATDRRRGCKFWVPLLHSLAAVYGGGYCLVPRR